MTRMTPSEAFVETMVAHGVTDMFGIMGFCFHGRHGYLRAGGDTPDTGGA